MNDREEKPSIIAGLFYTGLGCMLMLWGNFIITGNKADLVGWIVWTVSFGCFLGGLHHLVALGFFSWSALFVYSEPVGFV